MLLDYVQMIMATCLHDVREADLIAKIGGGGGGGVDPGASFA